MLQYVPYCYNLISGSTHVPCEQQLIKIFITTRIAIADTVKLIPESSENPHLESCEMRSSPLHSLPIGSRVQSVLSKLCACHLGIMASFSVVSLTLQISLCSGHICRLARTETHRYSEPSCCWPRQASAKEPASCSSNSNNSHSSNWGTPAEQCEQHHNGRRAG